MKKNNIQQIHSSPFKLVFVVSGGGTTALSSMLNIPGASKTVLAAHIPYAQKAMEKYLGKQPPLYCSLDTSIKLAMTAFKEAKELSENKDSLLGIAATASLATNYKKKGQHRFFLCAQSPSATHTFSCELNNNKRTREEEEKLMSSCLLTLISKACALTEDFPEIAEGFTYEVTRAEKEWQSLEQRKIPYLCPQKKPAQLIFPGSFNALHSGHLSMQRLAEKMSGKKLHFEISIENADKPALSYYDIHKILKQFPKNNWILTNAGTFVEKAKLFPKSTFVVGVDTLIRIFDSKFYGSDKNMELQLNSFLEEKIHFFVFGRKVKNNFISLEDISIPQAFKEICTSIDEKDFRYDISSSELKRKKSKV